MQRLNHTDVIATHAGSLTTAIPADQARASMVVIASSRTPNTASNLGCSADAQATILGSLDETLARPAWAEAIAAEMDRTAS